MTITGLAGYTSGGAIGITGVGSRAMWETGINMIGGYVIGSAELWTETTSSYNWMMRGAHTIGLLAKDAIYAYSAIDLPRAENSGRIVWDCPSSNTCSSSVAPQINPSSDSGIMIQAAYPYFKGTDSNHIGGLGIDLDKGGNITVAPNDWSFLTWSSGTYNFGFTDSATLNNAFVLSSSVAAFTVPILSQANITGSHIITTTHSTPNASSTCVSGEMHPDDNYLYVCTSAGTYKKVALSALLEIHG